MISYLEGIAKSADTVLVGGVGYKVTTPSPLPVGERVELLVTTVVREDAFLLYGFVTEAEQRLFETLCKVAGVGPASASSLLALGAPTVVAAIVAQDARTLTKARGLGAAGAKKLITLVKLPPDLLELANTGDALFRPAVVNDAAKELSETLVSMGYPKESAIEAAAAAVAAHDDDGARIQAAIAQLSTAA